MIKRKKKIVNYLLLFLAAVLCAGNLFPVPVRADEVKEDKNIMEGLVPTSNAENIENPNAATDGNKSDSNDDSNNTKITAGEEIGGEDNGYSQWQPVYLQYDFGEIYSIKKISLYRNTYDDAVSTFKDVTVEIASSEDFSDSQILYGSADYEETPDTKGQSQIISLEEAKDARYIRIWGKGHYIQNTISDWKGYSSGVLFNEIEVIGSVPKAEPEPKPETGEELVDANIMQGLIPTTNSTHKIVVGGPTVPQVVIQNPDSATDGVKSGSIDDSNNTKIIAGQETGAADNGYSGWDWVYLQYDFGKEREVKQVNLYRNTYDTAVSTFKDVKVELSSTDDFKYSTVIYAKGDYEETADNKGKPQSIELDNPVTAQYIRIWQKGHYIQNTNSAWKGYSNGVLFNEIEVIASIPASEVPTPPPSEEAKNIALGKIPYVQGLTPTNIEAITDGKTDDNYAVHNSNGERWLQFEYKNSYSMKEIKFKLEEGTYKSVNVSVSSSPTSTGESVFSKNNWTQGADMNVIDLGEGKMGKYVRFTVNKDDNSSAKYSEVEIWATGKNYDESKPEYIPPESKYDTLVWSDEFDGESVDESKWNIIDGMANHGAIYNRGAVSIKKDGDNSYLAINSKNYETTEKLIDAVGWDKYQNQELGKHVTWSSGRVESKNKFSFQFGRMAVRAKPNDSQGIWPAIWMLCQDETGHDEIDVLEYLGQDAWDAWTTNHFGILDKDKGSHGIAIKNYEAWSQDFHVYEVEWNPEIIKFFIDGVQVHSTTAGKDDGRDGMHTRSMFPILETQVGAGWVGDVDYTKQNTKQDSDYLIDWVRVYQTADQPITRFDDLETLSGGKTTDYNISAESHTDGLMELSDGEESYESKDNFYYGGQPRYETSRAAVKEGAKEQSLIYKIPGVKDVHLTTYYQTLEGVRTNTLGGDIKGASIRSALADGVNLDFKIYTSADKETWTRFKNVKVVDNFPEANPSYARHTFDAYGLPEGTNYVKIGFPDYESAEYKQPSGAMEKVKNTDIQLAKVTFLQEKGSSHSKPEEPELESIAITKAPEKTEYTEGEIFAPNGMEVTAKYSDGTEKKVTEEVTYNKGILKTEDKNVEISYTDNGVIKTANQEILVKSKDNEESEEGKVTGVKVFPENVEVNTGGTQKFTAEVKGNDKVSQEVAWQMSDNKSKQTEIDENGKLTVGKDETAEKIKVKAISKADTNKYGETIVKIRKDTGKKNGTNPSQKAGNGKTPSNGVKTGDETPVMLWGLAVVFIAAGVLVIRRKHQG